MNGGGEAEENSGDERDRNREREHRQAQSGVREAGNGGGAEADENAHARIGERYPESASGDAEESAFAEELSEHPSPAGSERGSQRDLPLAARGSREQETRDVGAGDEEHEPDRTPEDEERLPGASRDFIEIGDDDDPLPVVVRIGGGDPPRDGVHLRAHGLERGAGCEPSDGSKDVAAPILSPLLRERHRDPDLLVEREKGKPAGRLRPRRIDSLGHDADDFERLPVEGQLLSQDVARAPESSLP